MGGALFFVAGIIKPVLNMSGITISHPFTKTWIHKLKYPDNVFSFPNVISLPGLVFHLKNLHLTIVEAPVLDAPLPIYSTAAKRFPGCAVQIGLTDIVGLRRKFIIGVLSPMEPQKNLDLYFDSDQLKTLSMSIVGRPHLDMKQCEVQLVGTFHYNLPFGPELSKTLKENGYQELSNNLKIARLMKQVSNDVDASDLSDSSDTSNTSNESVSEENKRKKKDKSKQNDKLSDSENELEEFPPSEVHQIGPKSFLKKGVSIFELMTGHGRKAAIGDRVKIVYKGKLDPTKARTFDKATISKPFEFTLGSKKVIQGINIGVEGMCRESIRELIIPSHLGFGQAGLGDRVPPNAALYYDITLKEITPRGSWRKLQQKDHKESQIKKQKRQKETTRLLHVGNKIKI